MSITWYVIKEINPQPWAIGPLGMARKNGRMYPYIGPNPQLVNYKNAVREALVKDVVKMIDGPARMTFFFQRELEMHLTPTGRKSYAHEADSTNLQKALEDALQDLVIGNDRKNIDVRSAIMMQGRGVTPLIVIKVDDAPVFDYSEIPQNVWDEINRQPTLIPNSNLHSIPEDIF